MRSRRGHAQALLWLVMAVPLFISIAGLAIDGGSLFDSRRELQSMADGAARAGATRLDIPRLRASDGQDIELDAKLATEAARLYLEQSLSGTPHTWEAPPQAQIQVAGRQITVTLRARVDTAFLRIVFIETVPVEAIASADLEFGIHDGSGG